MISYIRSYAIGYTDFCMYFRGITDADDEDSVPYTLKSVTKPIISNEICAGIYRENFIINWTFCAGVLSGERDTCAGDGGAPFVVQDVQWGIVSWGRGCGQPNAPGIYTNVARYRHWLNRNMI